MKNYNLYLYFSLLSLQLVSPTPPRINLCCRENHAYKLNTKLPTRKKARCDFTPTVRLDLVTSWPRDSEVVFLVSEILKSSVVDWREGSTELVLYVENVQLALIYCWFGPHRVEQRDDSPAHSEQGNFVYFNGSQAKIKFFLKNDSCNCKKLNVIAYCIIGRFTDGAQFTVKTNRGNYIAKWKNLL